ncbi:MAG: FecR domain-containing protein [Alphaproteobacteria bacterium]
MTLAAFYIGVSQTAAMDLAQTQAPTMVKAGIAAAVRGSVQQISRGEPVGRAVQSGDAIFLGDEIKTGPSAGLQVVLMDETIFTIGPNASLAVDQFVYDPSNSKGKIAARIVTGGFRFVSGRVARNDPRDMTIGLPSGTIGIRGTSVEGVTDGDSTLVVLRGPGPANNAGEREGRIVVGNAAGEVLITRPGFATTFTASTPPSEPQRLTAEQQSRIRGAFTPSIGPSVGTGGASGTGGGPAQQDSQTPRGEGQSTGSGQGSSKGDGLPSGPDGVAQPIGQGPSPVQQAGQGAAGALGPLASFNSIQPIIQNANQAVVQAAQDSDIAVNQITTFAQLRTLTGTATMSASNIALDAIKGVGGGTYNISMMFNFSARTLDVTLNGNYNLGGVPGTLTSPTLESYANKNGPADGIINPYLSPQGFKIELALQARNNTTTGRIADVINHTVTVSDATNTNVIQTHGGVVGLKRP